MARISARNSDGALSHAAVAAHVQGVARGGALKYVPGFLYILVLYIAGKFIFSDPRARPSFLRTTPAKKPRTEWDCQPVAFMMAGMVAPWAR